jgi:bifunctional non-homologous end joining protein LigD
MATGFDQAALKSLYGVMQALRTNKKPFDQKVKDEKATTWLIPKLVGEVKFTEWTSEGEMRHPVFLGLRSDKVAVDVVPRIVMKIELSKGLTLPGVLSSF